MKGRLERRSLKEKNNLAFKATFALVAGEGQIDLVGEQMEVAN